MKYSIPSILLLLGAAHLQALPITSGQFVFVGPFEGGSFSLNGPNFSISGRLREEAPGPCRPHCDSEDSLFTQVYFGPDTVYTLQHSIQGTVNGVFYDDLSLGNSHSGPSSAFVVSAGAIPLTEQLVYTAPFGIEGSLILVRRSNFECVLCGPPGGDGLPMAIPVTGSGQATFELRVDLDHPGLYLLDRAVYEFQIPEPSTFWMLAALMVFACGLRARAHFERS